MTDYGEGTLYLRGRIWWMAYSVRGVQHWESTGTDKRHLARRRLQERLQEQRNGHTPAASERVTLADLKELHRNNYAMRSNRSWKRAKQAWAHLEAQLGAEARAVDLDYAAVERYAAHRKTDGAALSTIAYEVAALRRAFTLAVKAKILAFRPEFPTFKLDNARQGFFEPDELTRLLAELPDYLRPVAIFAYWTGWRGPSEILSLTWDRVDFDAGEIRTDSSRSKNKEARIFPFGVVPALRQLLEVQHKHAKGKYVFHHNGDRIKDYNTAWRGACKRAGLKGKIMHDFRRTAVRNLERAGISRDVARRLTGHKTDAVYSRYNIVNTRDLASAAAKLAEYEDKRSQP